MQSTGRPTRYSILCFLGEVQLTVNYPHLSVAGCSLLDAMTLELVNISPLSCTGRCWAIRDAETQIIGSL
jgi:hypothetical protein